MIQRETLTFAGIGLIFSILYILEGINYPLGTLAEPGPGVFPLFVGCLLIIGFIGIGIEATRMSSNIKAVWPVGEAKFRVLVIIFSCGAYVIMLPYLGQIIMGSLFAFAILNVMGLRSWPVKIILALVIGVGSYILFGLVLGVPLPLGALFD